MTNMSCYFFSVLVNFTTPIECLFNLDELIQTEEGQQTHFELQQHLSETKNIFLDQRVSKNIMQMMDDTLIRVIMC